MNILNEGISYINDVFEFDFVSNNEDNIIQFKNLPLEPVKFRDNAITRNTYYFGYEFLNNDKASSKIRSKFFHELKFNDKFTSTENKQKFVTEAINRLDNEINIYDFDIIVYPQSRSSLNQYMVKIISNVTNMELNTYEFVKKLPSEIKFDYEKFTEIELNSIANGRPRYTEAQKKQQIEKIEKIIKDINKSNYFSIAELVKTNKYKINFKPYFKTPRKYGKDTKVLINAKNILLLDDVTTTGATLLQCLRSLRTLNTDANIVLFTLVGKKDIFG
jgi:hypothetical protein